MNVASMAAPVQKAAPQAGTSAGDPAASGGTPADDQPSFESVLAHEEHTPVPPTGVGAAASGIPRSAKADEGKKPADGTAPVVAAPVVTTPPVILAALLATATPPAAAASTKVADVAAGSTDSALPTVGVAAAGKGEPPRPVDLARGALAALLPGLGSGTDQSDQSDRTDRMDQSERSGSHNGAAPRAATGTGTSGLAAASSNTVLRLPAALGQANPSAVVPADPSPRGQVHDSAPVMAGGPDIRGVGNRAASQGSAPLLHIETTAAPLTAKDSTAAAPALLAGGTAKTAEARDSRGTARPVADPGTSAGAGTTVTAPLATLLDAGGPKPSRDRPTANQGPVQLADKPVASPDPTNLSQAALGEGFAATISSVVQGVGQRISRMNDDDHAAPASPTPTHNQAVAVGPLDARPFILLPGPAGAAVSQPVIGTMARPSQAHAFHPDPAGGPSANQPRPSDALQNQPAPGSVTRIQPAVVASQTPLFPSGSAQPRPSQVARQPEPTEPSEVSQHPTMSSQDHRVAAVGPSRGTEASSIQSWANGIGALPTAQPVQPAADAARSASANQTGAVHEPIVQGILVRQASLQMVGAAASFKVVLHPRSLGEVTVQVTRVQEGLQVTIVPQQLTTQTLLNKHLPDLLGTLRTAQDVPVQAQVVAPHTPTPAPLGTPDAAAAGQSGLNFAANGGGGQSFTGGQGGEQRQAWVGTMTDLLREPARTALPAGRAGTAAARVAGNPRIDVQA